MRKLAPRDKLPITARFALDGSVSEVAARR